MTEDYILDDLLYERRYEALQDPHRDPQTVTHATGPAFAAWCRLQAAKAGFVFSATPLREVFDALMCGATGVSTECIVTLAVRKYPAPDMFDMDPARAVFLRTCINFRGEENDRRSKDAAYLPYVASLAPESGRVMYSASKRVLVLLETYVYGRLWPMRMPQLCVEAVDAARAPSPRSVVQWLQFVVRDMPSAELETMCIELFSGLMTPVCVGIRSCKSAYERYTDVFWELMRHEGYTEPMRNAAYIFSLDVMENLEECIVRGLGKPAAAGPHVNADLARAALLKEGEHAPRKLVGSILPENELAAALSILCVFINVSCNLGVKLTIKTNADAGKHTWCPPWAIHVGEDEVYMRVGEPQASDGPFSRPWADPSLMPQHLLRAAARTAADTVYAYISAMAAAFPNCSKLRAAASNIALGNTRATVPGRAIPVMD